MAMLSKDEAKDNLQFVRRYEPIDLSDMELRLRAIFAPWLVVAYNNNEDAEGEEVCDEEGGCNSSCVNSQTVRGD